MMRFQNSMLPILSVFLAFAVFGCTLQADKEEDAFEEVKYDSFKMFVDDVGPVPEQDMTGQMTGRWGYLSDGNLDGKPESFYQLPSPTGGIVGLTFGDDGYAAGGKAFGMTAFKAGQVHYETPLESLTKWVRDGAVLDIEESKYVDRPDILRYLDRISGEEMTAPLTGDKKEMVFQALPMGLVTLGVDNTTKSYPVHEQDKGDDYEPSAGDAFYGYCIDDEKPDYQEVCLKLDDAGMLAENGKVTCSKDAHCEADYSCLSGYCYNSQYGVFQAEPWGVKRCMQEMYYHADGAGGSRFNKCLMDNCLDVSNVRACFEKCKVEKLSDENGCFGEYDPEIGDVAYVIKSPAGTYQIEEGGAVLGTNSLSIFFDYMDADCNFHTRDDEWANIGQVVVEMTEGADGGTTFTLPPYALKLGCNSFEDKKMLGFTFANLSAGTYKFSITLKQFQIPLDEDRTPFSAENDPTKMTMEELGTFISQLEEIQDKNNVVSIYCYKESRAYEGAFVVSQDFKEGDNLVAQIDELTFLMHETFVQEIDEYGLGRGFIDVLAADPVYLNELMDLEVAMIQGYIWSVIETKSFPDWDMTTLNESIFGTTQNNRHTKYNENDDISSSAFYLDQPMSPGLFTFHGSAGWNIYPKAPYGANSDQPFILGDFETDEIYMPMRPFNSVDPKYSGCNFDADYWGDFLYHQLAEKNVLVGSQFERVYPCDRLENIFAKYFSSRDIKSFIADAEAYSAWPYWNCRINCLKDTDGETNGCYTLEDCLDRCTDYDPKVEGDNPVNQCDLPGAEPMNLSVDVVVPPEFASSPKYSQLLNRPEDPMACFDPDAMSCSDDGSLLMRCVAGRWVEEENCADDQYICLPTAGSFACDRSQCSQNDECEFACSGNRIMECADGDWVVAETCEEGYTCEDNRCKQRWEPLRIGLIPLETLMSSGTDLFSEIAGIPGAYVNYVPGVSRYLVPLPYMPYVTTQASITITRKDWSNFQMYMAIFDRDGNIYGISLDPTNTDPSFIASHLILWSSNWVGPDMEGWTLAETEVTPGSLSLAAYLNPHEDSLWMSFGNIEASGLDNLTPASVPQWE